MSLPARKLPPRKRPPLALHDRAMDDLRYIRETMERSGSFTNVSGLGSVAMGVVALVGAAVAADAPTRGAWIATWMVAACLAFTVAVGTTWAKARAAGESLLSGPGRKFASSVTPPLAVGGLLTLALATTSAHPLLPGIWLLLYGVGILGGGSFSVRVIPVMGLAFMALGAVALFAPADSADFFMAAGFGGLHILFGLVIWRKHGG